MSLKCACYKLSFINFTKLCYFLVSELENTCYILSKTKQSSESCISYANVNDNDNDDLDLMISTIQIKKSFYNKEDRTLKQFCLQDYCLNTVNETTYGNTVVMDLTSKYKFFKHNIRLNGFNNYVLRYLRQLYRHI